MRKWTITPLSQDQHWSQWDEIGRSHTVDAGDRDEACSPGRGNHVANSTRSSSHSAASTKNKISPSRAIVTPRKRKRSSIMPPQKIKHRKRAIVAAKRPRQPQEKSRADCYINHFDQPEKLEGRGSEMVPVRIDDLEKIEEFIDIRFRLMQQTGCRTIAKAWIGRREPQKQTFHPYNGRTKEEGVSGIHDYNNAGERTKPDWWPPTDGWPRRGCRHREPDHIKKSGK